MTLLSGLIGALIGSAITAVVGWLANGREIAAIERGRQRSDLRVPVADFWAAADVMHRAKGELGWTVFEIMQSKKEPFQVKSQLEERRQEAFARIREAELNLSSSLGLMRIICPPLESSARELMEASRAYTPRNLEDDSVQKKIDERRELALKAFEDAARKQLGGSEDEPQRSRLSRGLRRPRS